MSGIEVVGLIAGIVSAFSGAANLYRDWRQKKRERERQMQNENLNQVLVTSGPDVQRHYDEDFRRLGQPFARGDDLSRTALMTQLITLQQTVISLLTGGDPVQSLLHPNHGTLLHFSSSAHQNSINALAEQYQRMLQSAPISQLGSSSSQSMPNCGGKLKMSELVECDRYLALSQAGFPVLDSRDSSVNIQHHLLERGGGHYIDIGGTDLIAEGKVAVRGRVEPVAYTETGLRLSGGSALDTDAVIWCTGFADTDVRTTARELLGPEEASNQEGDLGPADIVMRLDASWGVNAEGEVRGVWKRHLRMENYWVMGGNIQQQRWWSRPMAQQIKLALDGSLPPPYRDTPVLR